MDNLPTKTEPVSSIDELIALRDQTEDPDIKRLTRWSIKQIERLRDRRPAGEDPELRELEIRGKKYDYYAKLAKTFATSSLVPKDLGEADLFYIIEMGDSVGLSAPQAIQSIASINGKPALWGDGLLAVVQNSPECEWIKEEQTTTTDEGLTAVCATLRRGMDQPVSRTFSEEDAKAAGLWATEGSTPWAKYPKRMLQMRARAWCLRDAYADVLKGFSSAEELQDISDAPIDPLPDIEHIELEAPQDLAGEAISAQSAPLLMELEQALGMLYNATSMAELIKAKDEVGGYTWLDDEREQLSALYADQKALIKVIQ